jgi:tryptophan-rich sensory protein
MSRRSIAMLVLSVVGCLVVDTLSGLTAASSSLYQSLEMPPLSPPGFLFPIVWTALYIMMGLALFLMIRLGDNRRYLWLFIIQLALNFVWTPLFFRYDMMLLAFADLVVLWVCVMLLILMSRDYDRRSSYLMIPYIVWLSFAAYLNIGAYLLN